jgi:hypothetical protein
VAWTTPKTWVDGELVTAAGLNQQIRDNSEYLKAQVEAVALAGLDVIPVTGVSANGGAPTPTYSVTSDGSLNFTSVGSTTLSGSYDLTLSSGSLGDYRMIRVMASQLTTEKGTNPTSWELYLYPTLAGSIVTTNTTMRVSDYSVLSGGVAQTNAPINKGMQISGWDVSYNVTFDMLDFWIENMGTNQVATVVSLPRAVAYLAAGPSVTQNKGATGVSVAVADGVLARIEFNKQRATAGYIKFLGIKK